MLQILKFAWTQYYSFLFLVYFFLCHCFFGFVVWNKVFYSVAGNKINEMILHQDQLSLVQRNL